MAPRSTHAKFNSSRTPPTFVNVVAFGEPDHNAFKALEVDDDLEGVDEEELDKTLLEDELGT